MKACEIHQQFQNGEKTAEAIVSECLGKIEQGKNLGAFLSVFNERALEKAKVLDEKRKKNEPLGKLAGIPIAIKDNILLSDEINTCASQFLKNYRAPYTATAAALLEEEDAIIIGKTNMDEFAMGGSGRHSSFEPTKNPWDLSCSPGGSSSGSAASVSARLCPVSLGSDTGGSIRQPAALCGVTGFKPTYGRVSRFGLVAFGSSLDQIGPLTTNVKDAALIMEVIGKYCEKDATSLNMTPVRYTLELEKPIKGLKIGVPWDFLQDIEGEVRENFEKSLEVYKSLGAEIVNVDLNTFKYGIAVYYILGAAEASTNLARFDGIRYGTRSNEAKTLSEIYDFSRRDGFGQEVKNRILLGTFVLSAGYQDAYYLKAQKVRTLIINQVKKAFETCSVLALPSSPGSAFPLEGTMTPMEEYLQDLYTVGANLAGLPAISVPSGFDTNNKPFGIQLMGPQTKDCEVFRFAHAFESATDFATKIPPNFGGEK